MDYTQPAAPAPDFKPSPKTLPKSMKVDSAVSKLDKQIADLQSKMNTSNPAMISQMLSLSAQRDALKQKQKPEVTVESAQDVQKAAPYTREGESGFFKGPEAPVGPATEAEVAAAKPYERIGTSGFFKGPDVKPEAAPVTATVPAAAVDGTPMAKAEIAKGEMPKPEAGAPIADKKALTATEEAGGIDWKTIGRNILEMVNAVAAGEAGVTDPSKLATGQRLAREAQAAELKASQDQHAAEISFQEKKDQLDREYQATQQAIQNKFTLDRDANQAKLAADEAAKKYQYDLGLIKAEAEKAMAIANDETGGWVKKLYPKIQAMQAAKAAGTAPAKAPAAPATMSAEQARALDKKRYDESVAREAAKGKK